jgi:type VI secretion system secreted protein VgrG
VATVSQEQRLIRVKTPLGDNVLVPTAFSGQEQISALFSFHLDVLSAEDTISASDLVGKRITISIERVDDEPRFFDGFVNRLTNFGMSHDMARYQVEVVPWLWFLTRTANCRIFQNKSIPDIVQQVLKDHGMTDFQVQLKGNFPPLEYCVQYRETAFNFVSRLLEREGIFYFFKHEDGKHTLVMANSKQAYAPCLEQEVEFLRIESGDTQVSRIDRWQHDYEFRPGKWAQTDYNFKTPSNSLLTSAETVVELPGNTKYEVFDFPGDYPDTDSGQTYADLRMEENETAHNVASGTSSCKTFSPGHWFDLTGHEIAAEDGEYVLTSVQHWASSAADAGGSSTAAEYGNSFTCIPKSVTYRPARNSRRPMVRGPQVAVVTGPAGEEIYTDKFGRVKVHFPWDRESKKDENSSCWVRVSQVHAGKGFGGIDIPRIGDEVVVTFYEGDPDRPVITGRLYHAENMPPFGLPGGMNVSGLKSNSTKGGGGYNEFVLDDTKGNELIRVHGQFDMDSTIENDLREHVLNNRSRDVTVNETIQIGADRSESVGGNESLSVAKNRKEDVGVDETLSVGSNRTRTVGGNETVTVALMRTHTVGINEAITVGAAQEVTVGGIRAVSVGISQTTSVGKSQTTTIGTNLTETIGGNSTQTTAKDRKVKVVKGRGTDIGIDDMLKVGKILAIDAGEEVVVKVGESMLRMNKNGTIDLQGKDITIDGSGKVTIKAKKDIVLKANGNILEN